MKKLTTISLFIFWAVTVAVLTAGLVFYQFVPACAPGPAGNNSPAVNSGGTTTLSLVEIAKHNTIRDCWLLVNNKIYSVAAYITAHPGGAGTIIPNCGQEATKAFNTKGENKPHSQNANTLLSQYYIGELNQTMGRTKLDQNIQQAENVPVPVRRSESENELENE